MKNQVYFKVFLILPLILFVDWMIMVVIGCASCLFGVGSNFYCGSYCLIGKGILLLSVVFFTFYLLFPFIKKAKVNKKHAPTS